MTFEELENIERNNADKLEIFRSGEIEKCEGITIGQLKNLVMEYLSDEQKEEMLLMQKYNFSTIFVGNVISSILDNNIKTRLLFDDSITKEIATFDLLKIIKSLNDDSKLKILHNIDFLKSKNFKSYDIKNVISSLNEESRAEILDDPEFIKGDLELQEFEILPLICSVTRDIKKLEYIDKYKLRNYSAGEVLCTVSNEEKTKALIEGRYDLSKYTCERVIAKMSSDEIIDFVNNHKDFINKKQIMLYEVIQKLDEQGQLNIVNNLDNINLEEFEKKEIVVFLNHDLKEKLRDDEKYIKYKDLFDIKTKSEGIIVDINDDLQKYKGLDRVMSVNPMKFKKHEKERMKELCHICPNMSVRDDINISESTTKEYLEAIEWIDDVIDKIDPNWSNVQKIAYVDNRVGKKISYSPDFDTEVFDIGGARSLYKIISTGYGVCNGISQVEMNILQQLGIDCEKASSKKHAFIKLKNIEIPTKEGVKIGNTILDPTWNLVAHYSGAKPNNFFRSYEEIRKRDIRSNGTDSYAHLNDEELSDATLDMDEETLREVYHSIGITNELRQFPIVDFIEKSKNIFEQELSVDTALSKQFDLLKEYFPDFDSKHSSIESILKDVVFDSTYLDYERCVIDRVYSKDDKYKNPVQYVYMDLGNNSKNFFYIDKNTHKITKCTQEEFEEKFECYDMDLEKNKGVRPWQKVIEEKQEELIKNSDKVQATKEVNDEEAR